MREASRKKPEQLLRRVNLAPHIRRSTSLDFAGEFTLQRGFIHHADELLNDRTALEQQERGDGAHPKLRGEFAVIVDVDLRNGELAFVFGRELLQNGSNHFAGSAPRCPEVDQDWCGTGDGGFEIGRIELDEVR